MAYNILVHLYGKNYTSLLFSRQTSVIVVCLQNYAYHNEYIAIMKTVKFSAILPTSREYWKASCLQSLSQRLHLPNLRHLSVTYKVGEKSEMSI